MNHQHQRSMFMAMAIKEFWQLSRDRLTSILLISVPLAQIILFGFAIELTPKNWPGAWVIDGVEIQQSATLKTANRQLQELALTKIREARWISLPDKASGLAQAQADMVSGKVKFILHFPIMTQAHFDQTAQVTLRLESDDSDPQVLAASALIVNKINQELRAVSAQQSDQPLIGKVELQSRFAITEGSGAYLVPALAGVVLTLTLILMAAFSLLRERERGTWDSLRSTQVTAPILVLGKMLPYFAIGIFLFFVMQCVSFFLFNSPFASLMQWCVAIFFIVCQLGVGVCISFVAKTQMQAMQIGVFFYLPSILLSGFMFPFHAMPSWARSIGEALPLTHFLRVLRADLFRHADTTTLISLAWPIVLMAFVLISVAMAVYHKRLH